MGEISSEWNLKQAEDLNIHNVLWFCSRANVAGICCIQGWAPVVYMDGERPSKYQIQSKQERLVWCAVFCGLVWVLVCSLCKASTREESHHRRQRKQPLQLRSVRISKTTCLVANSTHLFKPLDDAFYGPLKRYWWSILDDWKVRCSKKSSTLTKDSYESSTPSSIRTKWIWAPTSLLASKRLASTHWIQTKCRNACSIQN